MITNIGFILLAIFLLLYALMILVPAVGGHPMNIVMAILAFVTAILILVGR